MFRSRAVVVALAWVLLLGCGCRADSIPAAAKEMLAKAEQFELYSLDPDPREKPGENGFHGWKVLGKTAVKDADVRKKLVAALEKGAAENDGMVAGCFNPRHAIRVTRDGKTMDFVICFQCFQTEVYAGDKRDKDFLITASPKPVFDKVLKDADVPLAKSE